MPRCWTRLLTGAAVLASSVSAQALLIDFTDADRWTDGGSNPQVSNYGSLEVTVTALSGSAIVLSDGSLRFQNFDGSGDIGFCSDQGGAFACELDGGGIVDDEISYGVGAVRKDVQYISVAFNRAVDIDSLHFLDLFASSGSDLVPEVAQWAARGDAGLVGAGSVTGTAECTPDCAGYAAVTGLGYMGVRSIDFFADTAFKIASPSNSDFAIAGVGIVPVPPAVLLFGTFLLGLAGLNSRKSRRA